MYCFKVLMINLTVSLVSNKRSHLKKRITPLSKMKSKRKLRERYASQNVVKCPVEYAFIKSTSKRN